MIHIEEKRWIRAAIHDARDHHVAYDQYLYIIHAVITRVNRIMRSANITLDSISVSLVLAFPVRFFISVCAISFCPWKGDRLVP